MLEAVSTTDSFHFQLEVNGISKDAIFSMDINIHQWNTLPQHNVANPKNSWLQSRSIKQTQRESDKSSDASMFASLDKNFSVAAQ